MLLAKTGDADFHRVAQPRRAGWFADQAEIGYRPDAAHVFDQGNRAEFRRAFLIAGDYET